MPRGHGGRGRGGGFGRGGGQRGGGRGGHVNIYQANRPVHMKQIGQMNNSIRGAVFNSIVLHTQSQMFVFAEKDHIKVMNGEFSTQSEVRVEGEISCMHLLHNMLFVAMNAVVPNATAVEVGIITVFDLSVGLNKKEFMLGPNNVWSHRQRITCLESTEIGGNTVLFSGAEDGSINAWFRGSNGWQYQEFPGHIRKITGLKWCCDRLYSCSEDCTLQIWNPAQPPGSWHVATMLPSHHGHFDSTNNKPVKLVGLEALNIGGSPTSGAGANWFLFSAAEDGSIRSWKLANPDAPALEEAGVVTPPRHVRRNLTVIKMLRLKSTNSPQLACGFSDGMLVLRDLNNKLKESAGVGRGRSGSGGHHQSLLCIIPVVLTPTRENPSGATDVFLTSGRDHQFFAWEYQPPT